jgi:hypothetical protein
MYDKSKTSATKFKQNAVSCLDFPWIFLCVFWILLDFRFGFRCIFGLDFARLFPHTAYELTGEQPRHRCEEYQLRVNESNNNPLTYVSDKTVITTNILAGTIFPLRQCSFKLLSNGDHRVNKNCFLMALMHISQR